MASTLTSPSESPGRSSRSLSSSVPVSGFIHVATHGRWREILEEIFKSLHASGLYERTDRIHVGLVGEEIATFTPPDSKVQIVHRSTNIQEFEFPTLRNLHEYCQTHSCFVYYLHTKGVFRDSESVDLWRQYMLHFVVERHADCIAALAQNDVCGVNWQQTPWPHFSGNFWWARSDYIKQLNSIDSLPPVVEGRDQGIRHQCERWVCSGNQLREATLHQSHLHHYVAKYTRHLYVGPDAAESPYRNKSGDTLRIAVIFDNILQPNVVGAHCVAALRNFACTSHFLPSECTRIWGPAFDVFLYVDDGLDYEFPQHLGPYVYWATNPLFNPTLVQRRAKNAALVFVAKHESVEICRSIGIDFAEWLPVAGNPEVENKYDVPTYFDRMKMILNHISNRVLKTTFVSIGDSRSIVPGSVRTSIVIPVYNQLEYTRQCLASVRRHTTHPYEIIVVDNGSVDGTREYLSSQADVKLIANSVNRGFAASVNQGIKESGGSTVLILNNDTVVTTGWLERMLHALRAISGCGLVGPCSNNVPSSQRVKPTYANLGDLESFASQHAEDHRGQYRETAVLAGFCLLLDRKVIERVGGFDEQFGIGTYDDYEFCCRAREAGYRAVICLDVFVHHFGSVTLNAIGVDISALLKRNEQLLHSRVCSKQLLHSSLRSTGPRLREENSRVTPERWQNVYVGDSLIGDALFTEPALRARAIRDGRPIPLLICGPARVLFEMNPYVALFPTETDPDPTDATWKRLDVSAAFTHSAKHRCHICKGFFDQLGLDPVNSDFKPRLYGDEVQADKRPPVGQRNGRIALAPFSTSCSIHTSGIPNKTMDLTWWNELVAMLPLPADSFGAAQEPLLEGCGNIRGRPLREVAHLMQHYEIFIGGDTGLTAMAGALGCDIILLSAAVPVWLTGPQTSGRFEVLNSPTPPNWSHSDVLHKVQKLLGDVKLSPKESVNSSPTEQCPPDCMAGPMQI